MSHHLSQDQFAKCIAGRLARAELQHVADCRDCAAELQRFGSTLALFRSGVRARIDERVALHPSLATPLRPAEAGIWNWRVALVAAGFVVVIMLPFFMSEVPPQEAGERALSETSPGAVMDRLNLHLSRTVPSPMEPVMSLIPADQSITQSGEVQ